MNTKKHPGLLTFFMVLCLLLSSCSSKTGGEPLPAASSPGDADAAVSPNDPDGQKTPDARDNPAVPVIVPSGTGNIKAPSGSESETQDPPAAGGAVDFYYEPNIIDVPEDGEFYKIVVNKNHQLPADFAPAELETMYKSNWKLEKTASKHLTELLLDMEKEGLDVYPTSGFRTHEKQTELFNNKVETYKQTYKDRSEDEIISLAASIVAVPGSSEHQTGLAVDLTANGSLEQSFGKTKEGIWLAENCHKYGFIIRYPKDKEDVTAITYEPWHLRYVGVGLAEDIKNSGLCLEEYFNKPAV